MLGIGNIALTKKQHDEHVKHIISLLEKHENYEVILSDTPIQNIIVLAKENVGVMMINTKPPYCTFAFDEQNIVGAFWDDLSGVRKRARSKEKTIAALEALLSDESGNEIKKQSAGVKTGVLLREKKFCVFFYIMQKNIAFL